MSLTPTLDTDRLVILQLDPTSIWNLSQVCRGLAANCSNIWRDLIKRDFQIDRWVPPYNEQYHYLSKVNLYKTLEDGRLDALELLHRKDPIGEYEAEEASAHGHLDMLQWILQQDVKPTEGCIFNAITNNHLHIVEYLWPIVDMTWTYYPNTFEIVNLLLKLGAKPTEEWASGALFTENLELLDYFYQQGIVPSDTSLQIQMEFISYKLAVWLCEHNIYPTREDLSIAQSFGHDKVVKYFIEQGITPYSKYERLVYFQGQRDNGYIAYNTDDDGYEIHDNLNLFRDKGEYAMVEKHEEREFIVVLVGTTFYYLVRNENTEELINGHIPVY